jgi:hypothetical protein
MGKYCQITYIATHQCMVELNCCVFLSAMSSVFCVLFFMYIHERGSTVDLDKSLSLCANPYCGPSQPHDLYHLHGG